MESNHHLLVMSRVFLPLNYSDFHKYVIKLIFMCKFLLLTDLFLSDDSLNNLIVKYNNTNYIFEPFYSKHLIFQIILKKKNLKIFKKLYDLPLVLDLTLILDFVMALYIEKMKILVKRNNINHI